jgi:hypothetical protein
MISEEESLRNNIPSNVPRHIFFINEQSHELGDSERWVRLQQSQSLVCARANIDLRRLTGSRHLWGKSVFKREQTRSAHTEGVLSWVFRGS